MLNHKRIMSLIMAGAMAASLAVPAFAAESGESTTNRTIKVDGAYQAVDIAVVVPTSGTVVINPYSLPVEIGKDSDEKAVKVEGKQIVTKPLTIKNQSEVKLNVNVTATPTVKGNLALVTTPLTSETIPTEKKNSAFLYVAVESTTLEGAKDADAVNDAAITAAWKAKTDWTEYSADATNVVALTKSGTAASKTNMGVLTAAKMDDDGAFAEYQSGSIAFINVSGSCAQNPTTAWTVKDGVTIQIAFTFTPNTDA
jgi:hypothetical protein